MLFLHNRLEQADERSVHTGFWLQPPSIHHNQRQQSTQLGPRNTQGHGLIVNTVKTRREGGWTLGDDGNSESLGGVWGKIGEKRGGGRSDRWQPHFLSNGLQTREYEGMLPSKAGDPEKRWGQPRPPLNPRLTWDIRTSA